jgi:hypothetical protein
MDPLRHLMTAPCSRATIDAIVDEGMPLVTEHGLAGLTAAAVASRCRCSRQAVQQWCAGTPIRTLFARRFVARWVHWMSIRTRGGTLLEGLLPDCDEVTAWTRVWLALLEASARDDELAASVSTALRIERELVTAAVGPERAAEVHALVMGLRQTRCLVCEPLAADAASAILRDALERGPASKPCLRASKV